MISLPSVKARRRPQDARRTRLEPFPDIDSLPVSKSMQRQRERHESVVKFVKSGLEHLFHPRKGK